MKLSVSFSKLRSLSVPFFVIHARSPDVPLFVLQVALKTLIVIHRALREVDPTFREELLNYGRRRGHMLNLSHFRDDSSPNGIDSSYWTSLTCKRKVSEIWSFDVFLLFSMGLLCMGPELCLVFRGET